MSDAEVLSDYARYHAAQLHVCGVSSETDVRQTDVAHTAEEECADPSLAWFTLEQRPGLLLEAHRIFHDDPSTSGRTLIIGWEIDEVASFPVLGAFTELDDLRAPEGRIRQHIRSLRSARRLAYWDRLARRLEVLLEAMKEEEERWNDDSPESLRLMLLFLESVPTFQYPVVTVTPSTTFRAQWTVDSSRHFAADFLPDGQVRYVVFSPNLQQPDSVQRSSGITRRESLIEFVMPHQVQRWAADAGPQNP